MTKQGSSDTAGILQLAGIAALGAALWEFLYLTLWSQHHPVVLTAVLIGVAAAIACVLLQLWSWERLGGRDVVVMTNSWIRNRAVPPTLAPEEWVPLLRMRDQPASRQWGQLLLPGFWIANSVVHLVIDTSTSGQLTWVVILVLSISISAWTIYYNLRWLRVIRRLLRTAYAPETRAVSETHQDINA